MSTFPPEWEWREPTGRDYGIDAEVEPFEQGETMGRVLLLQIKGRRRSMPAAPAELGLSVATSFLTYAERFVSPFILVACPLLDTPPRTRFVWLQEYVRVRLPLDSPGWRSQASVTVHLPLSNEMPGAAARLKYVANYPQRLKSWGQLAQIQNTMRRGARIARNQIAQGTSPSSNDRKVFRRLLVEALRLPGLFLDKQNVLAQVTRAEAIRPGLRAGRLLLAGPPYSPNAIANLDWNTVGPAGYAPTGSSELDLLLRLEAVGEQLSSYLALATDTQEKQTAWAQLQVHEW
jgi:hypothetical protein